MIEILKFIETNPLLALVILGGIGSFIIGIFYTFAVMIRGWPKKNDKIPE